MILSMFFDLNESFLDSEAKGLQAEKVYKPNSVIDLLHSFKTKNCCKKEFKYLRQFLILGEFIFDPEHLLPLSN